MLILTWLLAALLALAFLAAGGMKLGRDRARLLADPHMSWANDFSGSQIKLIGLAEVLGAVGLIVPAALGIHPRLGLVAAVCLALLMIGAVVTHVRRRESPMPAAPLAIMSFVVAGLFYVAP